ncbi:MAG: A/G-specific adenine glycosylase [Verrucomicrobia bacterium]|nr:MAG: A/G-specific adenine glycosylase [Verrucomicrobiota bacterium]
MNSKKTISFRRALSSWFHKSKRDFPWRQTRDPYAILVSEIMLQQTQAATVISYYNRWLQWFPTVRSLAVATESEVLHAWEGLGYYARARNLYRCAKTIAGKLGGKFPIGPDALRSLPGIGRYTANAIAVFAFNKSLPIVEANTARVLTRRTDARQELWKLSAKLVPQNRARDFQNAMMDLGALICTAPNPRCQICPVKKFCRARDPASLPRKRKRAAMVRLTESHSLSRKKGAVLLERCHHRWRGMWMLPPLKLDGLKPLSLRRPVYVSAFPFTHHRVKLRVFRQPAGEIYAPSQRWFSTDALHAIPIPSPHRRAINALLA